MKIHKTLKQLGQEAAQYRRKGKKIGLCHGSFDVLHAGHIEHLAEAKKLCDILYVTVTADKYIVKPGKPILSAVLRARHLAQVNGIHGVAIVPDQSALPAIKIIKPDFYVKGKEYARLDLDPTGKIYDEKRAVEKNGGKLAFTNDTIVFSSSKIHAEQGLGPYIPLMQGFNLQQVNSVLAKLRHLRVAVLGDLVIDRWTEVKQVGVSTKAFCPSIHSVSCINQIGGAGAVARHLGNFVKQVRLYANHSAVKVPAPIDYVKVDPGELIVNRYWVPTEEKKLFETKIIKLQGIDLKILKDIRHYRPDLLLIADFGYGLIPHAVAQEIIKSLDGKIKTAVMVQSNSSNFGYNRLDKYLQGDMYVGDEREASLLVGNSSATQNELLNACVQRLQAKKKSKNIFITHGRYGASVITGKDGKLKIQKVPNLVRRTVDTIGCGDAFFSMASMCYAANIDPYLSLALANMAGAVCTQWLCNEKSVTPQHIVDIAKVTL